MGFAPAAGPAGGVRVIGSAPAPGALVQPITTGRGSLFAPRAACLGEDGVLWVADSGHHRLLGWLQVPAASGVAGDVLLGQPDDTGEARNAGGRLPAALGLNLPVGLCRTGRGLLVCDAWNHRVLLWREAPLSDRSPPDLVLGQADLSGCEINRGKPEPAADTLYWPFGACWDGRFLFVCDTGNRRLLAWDGLPAYNGQPADLVLGQAHFSLRDESGGHEPDARSMRWPHAVCRWGDRLCVADAGNHRIMVWDGLPARNDQPAAYLLGQPDAGSVSNNGGALSPGAAVLNMPYGLAVHRDTLWVADSANSRLLGWPVERLETGAPATRLFGQPDFASRGENRWQVPADDSLCWPYGLQCTGDTLVVADTGNQRVVLLQAGERTEAP